MQAPHEQFQCAEAIVELQDELVYKRRIEKRYRVKELDQRIRRERTKSEAKIISEARRKGVPTPIILDIDEYELVMERIDGQVAKAVIDEGISEQIGEFVGILHRNGIIHGDLTTSNIIVGSDNRIYFIDFGLAFIESSTEAQGVDVHVFFQSLKGTHEAHERLKEAFITGYKRTFARAAQVLTRVEEIERRGRYVER
ncbi:MAG: Kae1-associated kinase Bud32 [Methanophagales archaeon ANME-1-THS]|nr:MAG: Kae1-associated kinase Bud32 [Methanophagales archaeon ANME-1-THS]